MYSKIAQIFADYIYNNYDFEQQYVVLNYSDKVDEDDVKEAATVFAGNGVNCYLFEAPAEESRMQEAITKLESPAGLYIDGDGAVFYGAAGRLSAELATQFQEDAKKLEEDDIVRSEFGVSFSFMRIMYIEP